MTALVRQLIAMLGLLTGATLAGDLAAPPKQASSDAASELATLLDGDDVRFARALEAREFTFPRDHGPHPDFRNEWWYVTGNLDSDRGRRFGYELTIFRFSLTPRPIASESAWRTNQVYIAHFAVTDADGERFFVAERYSRGALGLAGAEAAPFRVWLENWEIAAQEELPSTQWRLRAGDEEFALEAMLAPLKLPVPNGIGGLSQKSAERGNASYYYSITRLNTQGTLRIGADEYRVSGLSWLDREWSSSALGPDQQGWDWFALQLSDGSDLMFYSIRRSDGTQDPHSAGTWIGSDGKASYLPREAVDVAVNRTWQSPGGGRYPAAWTLTLPTRKLTLEVRPVIADQELTTTVRYWEGAVDVLGDKDGEPISGRGYVELTGYADRVSLGQMR